MCDSHRVVSLSPSQWQSDADILDRRQMVKVIIGMLMSANKQQNLETIRKVLPIAKQVELHLYKSARNLAAYNEASTLENRVWEVVQASRKLGAGNGAWQSDRDLPTRRRMIKLIIKFLKKELQAENMTCITSTVLVSNVARQVEASMYQSAPCFVSYADEKTIESRIRLMRVRR